jgi:uncharacterized protein (DUF2267 family)/predicted transcriptional regulator
MIVQKPDATAYEAVRALSANHVGAVIVQDRGRVVGIVTDRDLACRTIGANLDARHTRLHDVMTPDPVTISSNDTEEQAAMLMRAQHVRRIPIVNRKRAVGIVTLDDLLMTGAVDLDTAAEIVESQLAEPAPLKPPGVPHPIRIRDINVVNYRDTKPPTLGHSRARNKLQVFESRLRSALRIADGQRAMTVFDVVASGLARRVTAGEAKDFAAQLPRSIQEKLLALPAGPDPLVTSETLVRDMAERLEVDRDEAPRLVRLVAARLADFVAAEEVANIIEQLPTDMKQLFPEEYWIQ